jgi:Tfp pilus assembly protein PilV
MKIGPRSSPPDARAFTLVEVMVAVTIFFMAMFALLGVLSSGIHAASVLRTSGPTAGMAAGQLALTNIIDEGNNSGTFGEIYQGYRWRSLAREVATNGLFQVDFAVTDPNGNDISFLTVLLYRPDSDNQKPGIH